MDGKIDKFGRLISTLKKKVKEQKDALEEQKTTLKKQDEVLEKQDWYLIAGLCINGVLLLIISIAALCACMNPSSSNTPRGPAREYRGPQRPRPRPRPVHHDNRPPKRGRGNG